MRKEVIDRVVYSTLEVWRYLGYIVLVAISAFMNYNLGASLGYDLITQVGWGVFFLALDSGKVYTFIRGRALYKRDKKRYLLVVYGGLAFISVFATASWALATIDRQSSALAGVDVSRETQQDVWADIVEAKRMEVTQADSQINSLLQRLATTPTEGYQGTARALNNQLNALRGDRREALQEIERLQASSVALRVEAAEESIVVRRSDSAFVLISNAVGGIFSPVQLMILIVFYSALMLEFFSLVVAPEERLASGEEEEKGKSVEGQESAPISESERVVAGTRTRKRYFLEAVIGAAFGGGVNGVLRPPSAVAVILGYPLAVVQKFYRLLEFRRGKGGNCLVERKGRRYCTGYAQEEILRVLGYQLPLVRE